MSSGFKILEPKIGKELKYCKQYSGGRAVDRMIYHGKKAEKKPLAFAAGANGKTPPSDSFIKKPILKNLDGVNFMKNLNEAKPHISEEFMKNLKKINKIFNK